MMGVCRQTKHCINNIDNISTLMHDTPYHLISSSPHVILAHLVHRVPDLRVREVELHLEVLEVTLGRVHELEGDVALTGSLDREDVLKTDNKKCKPKQHQTQRERERCR